jgi:hypothetical protein
MIPVITCDLPDGGIALLLTSSITGAVSYPDIDNSTRVFCKHWPGGELIVDMPVNEFFTEWTASILGLDLKKVEYEYEYVITSDDLH